MKMTTVVLAVFLMLNIYAGRLWAEEGGAAMPDAPATTETAGSPAPAADEMEYSFGEVKSISTSQLVLLEYDYLTDKESDVTYSVDPAVTYENAKSIDEIKVGDSIEIDYINQGQSKVVKTIILEKEEDAFAGDDLGADSTAGAPAAGAEGKAEEETAAK